MGSTCSRMEHYFIVMHSKVVFFIYICIKGGLLARTIIYLTDNRDSMANETTKRSLKMYNLIDQVLTKIEKVASHPSRFMAMADSILDRIAPKDTVAALSGCYTQTQSYCEYTQPCGQGRWPKVVRTRLCCYKPSLVCGPWSGWSASGCC